MNKQKPGGIGWCDYTWGPVTGCLHGCDYCYAAKIARRFGGPEGFKPTFHPERLGQPAKVKKPSRIFVVSMGDLFGDWVPREWIWRVLERVNDAKNSHHTFQFLTKNPKRLQEFNPWPKNCWVGTTVTNQADADTRLPELFKTDAPVRFVSHEPLMGPVRNIEDICEPWTLDWAIIGAMTGPGAVRPQPRWVEGLILQYSQAGVPIFLKDNLNWPEKIQEWPHDLPKV